MVNGKAKLYRPIVPGVDKKILKLPTEGAVGSTSFGKLVSPTLAD